MRPFTSLVTCGLLLALIVSVGCSSGTSLGNKQRYSDDRIAELERDLQTAQDDKSRLEGELTTQQARTEKIRQESEFQDALFKEALAENKKLAERIGRVGPLPQELDDMLAAFAAANSELLSYDASKGRVSLQSDVTFALGSDVVKSQTKPVLAALAQICSAEQAQDCRVLVVGHTDDVPIVYHETKAKHPTNWHLSVHRAIAVKDVLKKHMPEDRLAVMGFGQFKPIAENAPNKQGNPLNRRVEIFIVAGDMEVPSAGLK